VVAERASKGKPIGNNDAWIAACAVRHAVSLVTHNAKKFIEITGLKVITKK
jgi:predicted nucleic acid-binding protein